MSPKVNTFFCASNTVPCTDDVLLWPDETAQKERTRSEVSTTKRFSLPVISRQKRLMRIQIGSSERVDSDRRCEAVGCAANPPDSNQVGGELQPQPNQNL